MDELEREVDVSELQRMVAAEEQRARLTAQVHNFMEVCWEKCVDKPGSKLDSRTESCLANCVNRFIDTTLSVTNRFAQVLQKGGH
ncbi:mitochondrial import inner membrane translocase subunit Tim8 B [Anolis carolinensis]|uniref:mitochondrial import inner membrane translocase subunit Tim8 B n=1 Tax=Anolis carolinensis TaxID=28377 RepID=UPI002F2B7E79